VAEAAPLQPRAWLKLRPFNTASSRVFPAACESSALI
jgi:hypothetical protein